MAETGIDVLIGTATRSEIETAVDPQVEITTVKAMENMAKPIDFIATEVLVRSAI
jgi:hypothetical protein